MPHTAKGIEEIANASGTGEPGCIPAGGTLANRLAECVADIAASLFHLRCRSPWLTVREAERYARVRHGVLREAVKKGEIESYRRPGSTATIVRAERVDEWIESTWESGRRREWEL